MRSKACMSIASCWNVLVPRTGKQEDNYLYCSQFLGYVKRFKIHPAFDCSFVSQVPATWRKVAYAQYKDLTCLLLIMRH